MNFSITELSGKKIGFIGTGTLATEAAKRLQGFDVEVWGVNTTGHNREYFDKKLDEQIDAYFKPRNREERRRLEKLNRSKDIKRAMAKNNFKERIKQETYKELLKRIKEKNYYEDTI